MEASSDINYDVAERAVRMHGQPPSETTRDSNIEHEFLFEVTVSSELGLRRPVAHVVCSLLGIVQVAAVPTT